MIISIDAEKAFDKIHLIFDKGGKDIQWKKDI